MSGVNKVIILGRVGKDAEVKNLPNGQMVANFSIATSESYKDKTTGEKKETTEWHNIVVWRGLAEIASKYVKKGDMVYIEGKLRTRSWEKDGVTRYVTEIVGDSMQWLGNKRQDGGSGASSQASQQTSYQPSYSDNTASDDLPF